MKRALIIGGSGFLGKHLMAELKNQNTEIFALLHKNAIPEIDHHRIIRGGLKAVTPEMIDEIKADVIFHAARPVIPRLKKWGRILSAWNAAHLNRHLIKQLKKSDTKPPLVFASGSLMYGNSPDPHFENAPLNPISFARQYYKGELPVVEAAQKGNYPVQVFRLPWLLGDGSWFRWFYLENIRKTKSIPKFGDGHNMMEIIDVRDAVRLMVQIANESRFYGIVNIPSAGAITQQKFLENVAKVYHVQIVDFSQLYPMSLEREITEAYTSNIMFSTKHPDLFEKFKYIPLEQSLDFLKAK